jgi:hypothetical protein
VRDQVRENVLLKAAEYVNFAHYHVSVAAINIYNTGLFFWESAGELKVTLLDVEWPLGQPLMMLALLWKGRPLLMLHSLSYLVLKINTELIQNSKRARENHRYRPQW